MPKFGEPHLNPGKLCKINSRFRLDPPPPPCFMQHCLSFQCHHHIAATNHPSLNRLLALCYTSGSCWFTKYTSPIALIMMLSISFRQNHDVPLLGIITSHTATHFNVTPLIAVNLGFDESLGCGGRSLNWSMMSGIIFRICRIRNFAVYEEWATQHRNKTPR